LEVKEKSAMQIRCQGNIGIKARDEAKSWILRHKIDVKFIANFAQLFRNWETEHVIFISLSAYNLQNRLCGLF